MRVIQEMNSTNKDNKANMKNVERELEKQRPLPCYVMADFQAQIRTEQTGMT